MTPAFWTGWELWEEFTFVLALGIAAIFAFGAFKLVLSKRRVRKHEKLDEEKRIRTQEMLQSPGHKPRKSRRGADVPFGVRALESGTHVPGIYIERNSLKASLCPSTSSGSFSDPVTAYTGSNIGSATSNTSNVTKPSTSATPFIGVGQPRSQPPPSSDDAPIRHIQTEPVKYLSDDEAHGRHTSAARSSYMPKYSSGLRNSEGLQYEQDALQALEGRRRSSTSVIPRGHPAYMTSKASSKNYHQSSPKMLEAHVSLMGSSKNQTLFPGSSQNQPSSTHDSQDRPSSSESSQSSKKQTAVRPKHDYKAPPLAYHNRASIPQTQRSAPAARTSTKYQPVAIESPPGSAGAEIQASCDKHEQSTDYFPISSAEDGEYTSFSSNAPRPASLTPSERSDPFATPGSSRHSVVDHGYIYSTSRSASAVQPYYGLGPVTEDHNDHLERTRQDQSIQYGAGQLHANKNTRISNSVFQVLPAGTFGTPVEHADGDGDDEGQSLQKKSSLLKRASRTLSRMSGNSTGSRSSRRSSVM